MFFEITDLRYTRTYYCSNVSRQQLDDRCQWECPTTVLTLWAPFRMYFHTSLRLVKYCLIHLPDWRFLASEREVSWLHWAFARLLWAPPNRVAFSGFVMMAGITRLLTIIHVSFLFVECSPTALQRLALCQPALGQRPIFVCLPTTKGWLTVNHMMGRDYNSSWWLFWVGHLSLPLCHKMGP